MARRVECSSFFIVGILLFLATTFFYLPVTIDAAASNTLRRLQLQQSAFAGLSGSHATMSRVEIQRQLLAIDTSSEQQQEQENLASVHARKLEAPTEVTGLSDLPNSVNTLFQFAPTDQTSATNKDIPPEDDQLRQRNGSAVVEIRKDFVWTIPILTDANTTTEVVNPATVPHWLTFSIYIDPEQLLDGDYLQLFAGDAHLVGELVMQWDTAFLQQLYDQVLLNMTEAEAADGTEAAEAIATTAAIPSRIVLSNPINWFQVDVLATQATFRLHLANASHSGNQAAGDAPLFIANWTMSTSCPQNFQLNEKTQTCEQVSELEHSAWLPLFVILPGLFVISLVVCWLSPRNFRRKHCPKWCPIMFLSHSTFEDRKREILAKKKLAAEGKGALEFEELSKSGIAAAAADEMAQEDENAKMNGNNKEYDKNLSQERERSKSDNDFLYGDGEGYEEPTPIHMPTAEPNITVDDEHHSSKKEGDATPAAAAVVGAATAGAVSTKAHHVSKEEELSPAKATADEEREKRLEREADDASPHATRRASPTPRASSTKTAASKPSTKTPAKLSRDRNRNGWQIDDVILDELGGLFRKEGCTGAEHIIHQPGDISEESVAECAMEKYSNKKGKNLAISVETKDGGDDQRTPQSSAKDGGDGDTPGIVDALLDYGSGDAEKSWIKRLKSEIKRTLFVWVFELIGTSVNIYFAIVYLNPSEKSPDRWSDQLSTSYLSFAMLAFIGALINAWSRISVIRELIVEMHTAFHSSLRHAQYNNTRVAPSIELAFMERRIHHLKIVGLTLLVESIPFAAMGFYKLYRFNSVQQNLSLLVSCGVSAFWVGSKITRLIAIPENRDKCKRLEEDAFGQLDWEHEEDVRKERAQKRREESQRRSRHSRSQSQSRSKSRSPHTPQSQSPEKKPLKDVKSTPESVATNGKV